ncbi:MAG: hypothetical protein HFH68_08485 [Lachnospiraceae bacterium]|nr:hypothetical protein [Lachnospiraceae bacterium]
MAKILIWGTGSRAKRNYKIAKRTGMLDNNTIIGFIDNNSKKCGTSIEGLPVMLPSEIKNVQYDYICIWSTYKQEILEQMEKELFIPLDKEKDILKEYFLNSLKDKYSLNYNEEIKSILEIIDKSDDISVYNFVPECKDELYEAFYDENADLYYIFFENKRLYLKREYEFILMNNKKYVKNIWYEQDINSPHLYEEGDVVVSSNDVLVDAGVCEGNFSLHNIDKVKKVYLIECNPDWIEALKYTFAPYKDKVVFCNNFLSNIDSGNKVSLDNLLKGEKISFLKMDIEGEEINALYGARKTLTNSIGVKCSICSYHHNNDEMEIKRILKSYGMNVTTSKGYMLFLYDIDVCKNPELRRGIVRGIKQQ